MISKEKYIENRDAFMKKYGDMFIGEIVINSNILHDTLPQDNAMIDAEMGISFESLGTILDKHFVRKSDIPKVVLEKIPDEVYRNISEIEIEQKKFLQKSVNDAFDLISST